MEEKSLQISFEDLPAKIEEVEAFYEHLQEVLQDIQFLKLQQPRKLMNRLRRLFQRAKMTREEVNILRGILTVVSRLSR